VDVNRGQGPFVPPPPSRHCLAGGVPQPSVGLPSPAVFPCHQPGSGKGRPVPPSLGSQ
jgi:hypothetical protein